MRWVLAIMVLAGSVMSLVAVTYESAWLDDQRQELLNRPDANSAAALFADDAALSEGGASIHGREQIRRWLRRYAAQPASVTFSKPGQLHASGNSAEVAIELRGASGAPEHVAGQATVERGRITSIDFKEHSAYIREFTSRPQDVSIVIIGVAALAVLLCVLCWYSSASWSAEPLRERRQLGRLIPALHDWRR